MAAGAACQMARGADESPAPPPKLTHEYPSYTGPGGLLAGRSTVPTLADLSQARLVWVNEQEDLGYAKTTSGGGHCYPQQMKPSGCGSLILAGGVVIAGYFHPKDDIAADDIVVAVDAVTGKTRWKQVYKDKGLNRGASKHPVYGPIPAAGDGKVFHLGSGGLVYGVDLATGKPLWETGLAEYRAQLEKLLAKHAGKSPTKRSAAAGYEKEWPWPTLDWPWLMIAPLQVVDKTVFATVGPWFLDEKHNPPKNEEEKAMRRSVMLFALDADSGKILWSIQNAISRGTTVCAADVNGKRYALAAGHDGYLRLLRPRTGEVVWKEYLGVPHRVQPIVVGGRAFVIRAREPDPAALKSAEEGMLTAYALSEAGAKLLWQSKQPLSGIMAWTPMSYRDGVLYAELGVAKAQCTIHALKAEDGTVLGRAAAKGKGYSVFFVWGDRVVLPSDVAHESMGFGCSYTALSPLTAEAKGLEPMGGLEPTGKPWAPRNHPGYKGVCGYELAMRDPMADGCLFTRAVYVKKGVGVIMCWDIGDRTGKP
jgi:outer membrane protein assembly factor BamB